METLIIVVVLILMVAFTSILAFNTIKEQQEAKIAELIIEQEKDVAKLEAEIVSLRAELVVERTPEPYSLPLEQLWISSGTGYRMPPLGGVGIDETLHRGVDLAAAIGTPVRAVLAGKVIEHYLPPGTHWGKEYYGHPIYGSMIVLSHGDGLLTRYAHLSETFVHEGDWIEMGQIIGEVGNTGISTANHLHFEVIIDGLRYLGER